MKHLNWAIVLSYLIITISCNSPDKEIGIVINGVTWSTKNVDKPEHFTLSPENFGMFYQWNSKIGWSSTNPISNTNNENSWYEIGNRITEWNQENNPCPKGWRLPTIDEFKSLLDTKKVEKRWNQENNTNGQLFIDKENNNSIFLPAGGIRDSKGNLNLQNIYGRYLSSSYKTSYAYYFTFDKNRTSIGDGNISGTGFSIRCVKE